MDSQENVLQQDKFENEQKTAQAASEVENVSTEEVKEIGRASCRERV